MTVHNRLGWIDCTDGNAATALMQAVQLPWVIQKWDAENALQALSERQPDAIVFDFCDASKENLRLLLTVKRRYPAIPILMVTEEHSETLAIWAFRARVWNYFVKPVSIREFNRNLTQLAKVIAARGSSSREIERPSSTFPGQSDAGGNSPGVIDLIAETMRRDYARARSGRAHRRNDAPRLCKGTARRRPRAVFEDEPLPILPVVQAQFRVQLPHLPDAPADRVSVPFAQ